MLVFYFFDLQEQLKTNFYTNFCSKWVLGFVIFRGIWLSQLFVYFKKVLNRQNGFKTTLGRLGCHKDFEITQAQIKVNFFYLNPLLQVEFRAIFGPFSYILLNGSKRNAILSCMEITNNIWVACDEQSSFQSAWSANKPARRYVNWVRYSSLPSVTWGAISDKKYVQIVSELCSSTVKTVLWAKWVRG